ncbi:MAG: hypothetical protein PHZ09_00270 [Eubacteriales bacterium]|jgi:membrane protein implicated in regulation of membrane protease activity|nr:hypothetical protein [Eubacteriales bacterium]
MAAWYNSLETIQRIFALIAIPSTAVLIIQTILLLLGVGSGKKTNYVSAGALVPMVSVCGWSGIALTELNINTVFAVVLSVLSGLSVFIGITLFLKYRMTLYISDNSDNTDNTEIKDIVGRTGRVYMPVPSKLNGSGKVTVTIGNKRYDINAVTRDREGLRTGETVRIVAFDKNGMPVVERMSITKTAYR